uniref:Pentatricopeptide repeat-containing protein n=1 Tax=Glycine max TaxID=3847 RepID=A0A0R0IZS5_SOYBN
MVLHHSSKPTLFLYNKLIQAYSSHPQHQHRCFSLYSQIRLHGFLPNQHTFNFLFSACTSLSSSSLGQMLHTHFIKSGFEPDLFAATALLDMYAKVGALELARKLFDEMPVRGVPRWNAMMAGLARFGDMDGALEFNAVLEMYVKCGKIDAAWRVFNEIGSLRNLCSWNSMVVGLAVHGECCKALELYDQMLGEGTSPDDVTFVGLLLACTQGGMVKKGRHIFKSKTTSFYIIPKLEHYGCMVDLLGRAGQLREAYEVIQSMSMKPDSVIWGALLGACSFHVSLFVLEPWNPGNYVILSNIYASAGQWDGVAKLRKVMKGSKITKSAGHSFIEEGAQLHKFIVKDRSHPKSNEIFALLDGVYEMVKLTRSAFECHLDLDLRN